MSILVLNAGSSSLKFMVSRASRSPLRGQIEGVGTSLCRMIFQKKETLMPNASMGAALSHTLSLLPLGDIQGVGHRVVHGGPFFDGPAIVDENTKSKIKDLYALAPLHNPACMAGIDAALEALPRLANRNVACFDTAFHSTLSPVARTYAVPWEMARDLGIRRYGFHGLSVEYVYGRACEILHLNPERAHMLVCHLGAGCSITAVNSGKSVDTTMGLTPLDGLVMSTRAGAVDPGLYSYIHAQTGLSESEITDILNKKSGLRGVSGVSGDMRVILDRARNSEDEEERKRCALARDVFVHRVCQSIAMLWVDIARLDGLVFTGGIGENSAEMRSLIVEKWGYRGMMIDEERNNILGVEGTISKDRSASQVAVIHTNEEEQIAKHTRRVLGLPEDY
eukprot:TRINITY_DN21208_c0_g1_i1.p1 TRINITY_DN21208_c0_g1~~TRINITY_DN21208_c0_g1_i1.p1  ORF type:complete len:394 (+),score=57.88 TRINITY_DN21208_c0_g1_i1:62-1243(+)